MQPGTLSSPGPVAAKAPEELGRELTAAALELGFARVAFAPVQRLERGGAAFERWLSAGYAGEMTYLEGSGDRADPRALLAEVKSVVVVALQYASGADQPVPLTTRDGRALTGTVARYARGRDYHQVLRDRLLVLAERAAELVGRPVLSRACVDTAPLLERESAALAGLGFIGKNTLAIVAGLGSYVLLGELLLDVEIAPGVPAEPRCGACRACLDVCPTGAFVEPYVLDARRCIAYLTIEYTGVIPRELRSAIGTRVFGCDACQEICPYNASPHPRPILPEFAPRPEVEPVDLEALLELGSATYRKFVKRSSLRRANRSTLSRNAAVALGNTHDARAEAPLARAVLGHPIALVRGHAAWALGELGPKLGAAGRHALERARGGDDDAWVREEAALALERCAEPRPEPPLAPSRRE
jgi:epoxyqueuosine reductase